MDWNRAYLGIRKKSIKKITSAEGGCYVVNKPKKQTLLIILLMICLCTTFISFFIMEAKELKSKLVDQYNSALQMIMDKKYDEAIQSLKELGDYQNA